VELLSGVADDTGMSLAQLAVAWTLNNRDVLTRIDHLLGSAGQTDPRLTWSPPAAFFAPMT
jgi:aryl-alcohol dehydrogenase-like predicted oxidoreductase